MSALVVVFLAINKLVQLIHQRRDARREDNAVRVSC